MPKRTDIKSILIIGAGPIVIGQACEFDYSGTQACKALRDEGYRVVLVNSNPATIMTDPEHGRRHLHRADHAGDGREDHRARSGPTRMLPTMGGQTALNRAMALARDGVLDEVRRRADRRQRRGDRQGRGPPAVPRGDDQDRPRARRRAGVAHIAGGGARRRSTTIGLPGDHPPLLHAGRHRRRHRLQPRGVRRDRAAAASTPRRPPRC